MVIDSVVEPLLDFWDETRLRARDARSSSVSGRPGEPVSLREALEHVLWVVYGRATRCRVAGRRFYLEERYTSPSAGAIYPFEILVILPGAAPGVFVYDPDEGCLEPFDAEAPTSDELCAAGLRPPREEHFEALILLLARPWRSVKKYLDVGHAAVNFSLYAASVGRRPTVHLRFDRRGLCRHLGLENLCREPLVALSFTAPSKAAAAEPIPPEITNREVTGFAAPEAEEMARWRKLQGLLSFDHPHFPATEPTSVSPVLEMDPGGPGESVTLPVPLPPPASAWEWRSAILGRRSARGFRPEPLDEVRIGALLAAIRGEELRLDAADAPGLGIRLLARDIGGLQGVYAYCAAGHALRPIGPLEGDFVLACLRQEVARNAAALLVLHAPVRTRIAQRGWTAFAEIHFQAAHIAQRIGLAAGRCGVGMTSIGGFDDAHCAQLARLPEGEECVYVLVLGVADDKAVKSDRAAIAASHGYQS